MATIEKVATFSAPGQADSPVELKARYENFIGGHWVAPVHGEYSENVAPATGETFTEVPRSTPEDVELALDAAHAVQVAWSETSTTERSRVLNKVADAIEDNLELLAVAELGEQRAGARDARGRHPARSRPLPLLRLGHPRRGGDLRARQEHGGVPRGATRRRRPDHPVQLPDPDGGLEAALALAAGNAVVLKPASPTPWSILKLMELIEEVILRA